ncbi:MAG: uroporphyrinogen decarboxylase family protein [Phycisphaerae bacterium]|nr:uroporphyrinogen decarboxylase family protein [Phycisphaerae bacterium]
MLTIDFAKHNAAAKQLWADFWAGKAARVPMTISANYRMIVLDPALNTRGHSFGRIFGDPAAMIEVQADFKDWYRHNVLCDEQLGPVAQYDVGVSFMNCYDALYFGCPLHFRQGQIPDTSPWLLEDNRDGLFDRDFSEAAALKHEWVARSIEFHGYAVAQRGKWERNGVTIGDVNPAFLGSDGPFTAACAVRPPDLVMIDMMDDPAYVHRLMGTITDALITRTRAMRRHYGQPLVAKSAGLADDACMMLSPRMYREFVLPYHRRMLTELADVAAIKATGKGGIGVHLCGDASHLFKIMVDELGVTSFDTGFPIDHGKVRRELGPSIWINGGPGIQTLKDGTPAEVFAETKGILQSGIKAGGRFILREGNNLAPCTPMANIAAMYEANLQFGAM